MPVFFKVTQISFIFQVFFKVTTNFLGFFMAIDLFLPVFKVFKVTLRTLAMLHFLTIASNYTPAIHAHNQRTTALHIPQQSTRDLLTQKVRKKEEIRTHVIHAYDMQKRRENKIHVYQHSAAIKIRHYKERSLHIKTCHMK